jgi:hypothetical protein
MSRHAGAHTFVTPLGTVVEKVDCKVVTNGSITQRTAKANANGLSAEAQETRRKFSLLLQQSKDLVAPIPSDSNPTVPRPEPPQFCLWGEQTLPKNKEFQQAVLKRTEDEWWAAEAEMARNSRINICVKQNLEAIKGTSKKKFDLGGMLLSKGLDLALGEINKYLPGYAQLNVSRTADGKGIESIGVGGVSYNPSKSEVYVGSQVFSTLVDSGLSGLNQTQPGFAQVRSSVEGLWVGGLTVSFKDLAKAEDGTIKPLDKQALGPGMYVRADKTGNIYVEKGTSFFDVGKLKVVGNSLAAQAFDYGLSTANAQLPDFLQLRNDQSGLSLGPVSYDPKTGKVALSASAAESTLLGLGGQYLSALAPKDSLGLLLWNAVDPLNLFSRLLKQILGTAPKGAKKTSRAALLEACTRKYTPATPQVLPPYVDTKELPPVHPELFPRLDAGVA